MLPHDKHWVRAGVSNRIDMLKELDIRGLGVEVGVSKGHYSKQILLHTDIELLYSIDIWRNDIIYAEALQRLLPFGCRNYCIRLDSMKSSELFKDDSLDFIYIDANHTYPSVKQDIKVWWAKIKKQGAIFAGHDYVRASESNGVEYGVIRAVDEHATALDLKVHITRDETFKTWYIIL